MQSTAAMLFIAQTLTAQNNCEPKCKPTPCPQPNPPTQVCEQDPCCPAWETPVLNAAYNYSARPQTKCSWDLYVDASFVYWQPIQENMELALSNSLSGTEINGSMVNMAFDYKPGFKIAMGGYFDYDNWDLSAEYTWFHSNQSKNTENLTGGVLLSTWQHPFAAGSFTKLTEKWNLKVDLADVDLGRWQYVGKNFTIRPNIGARGAWIRQDVSVIGMVSTLNTSNITVKSHSWGLGAKTGVDTNWMIGSGFRVIGNAEADLLFTNYTGLSYRSLLPFTPANDIFIKQKSVYAVKPHLDLELGLGWSTYLDCNNWYLDFAATYEFQVFFDQNMFRHFNDDQMTASSRLPNGNLYLQGLTLTAKLEY